MKKFGEKLSVFTPFVILSVFVNCGGGDSPAKLSGLPSPGETLGRLSAATLVADPESAGSEQPRTCRSLSCPLISSVLVNEIFAGTPDSLLGQIQAVDTQLEADKERFKDDEVSCLKKVGVNFNLDLSFTPISFPYTLSCLSKEIGSRHSSFDNFIAYGLNYETGVYSIRSAKLEPFDAKSLFVNSDELGNAEAWQFQVLEGTHVTISHILMKTGMRDFEIVTASSIRDTQTACGVQLRGKSDLLYVEGKFLDDSGALHCDRLEKRALCFDMKRWQQVDGESCVNSGLTNFALQQINALDFNIDNIKAQIAVSAELRKMEAPMIGPRVAPDAAENSQNEDE